MRSLDQKGIKRVLDANYNRAKEALRVCEDISRFILDHKGFTRQYKDLRHTLFEIQKKMFKKRKDFLSSRDISSDVGKSTSSVELKRRSAEEIFWANSQRIKESVRVLEEFAKLKNKKLALVLKKVRYNVYALERKIAEKF